MKTWKIYIVTHGPIIPEFYKDPNFSDEHWEFINVGENRIENSEYSILNKHDIKEFIHLGKQYAEFEAIYNVYKMQLHTKYDYIGFIHYDYELNNSGNIRITKLLDEVVNLDNNFISFSTYYFQKDYLQHIMMDENFPNKLKGNGKNCYLEIIEDYNKFFSTNLTRDKLLIKNPRINLCDAFLLDSRMFEDMLNFISIIIESGKLNKFDTQHRYRFQGGIMERYVGIYSSQLKLYEIELPHHYNKKYENT